MQQRKLLIRLVIEIAAILFWFATTIEYYQLRYATVPRDEFTFDIGTSFLYLWPFALSLIYLFGLSYLVYTDLMAFRLKR